MPSRSLLAAGLLLTCVGCFGQVTAAGAEVRAVVVGINEYERLPRLKGAVADAGDIAEKLRKVGVEDLTVLIDGNASRDRLMGALRDVSTRARSNDLVIFSFAGHGAQEPERVPGSELDGRDEVFLLGGFEKSGLGSRERIIDNEIDAWLRRLGERGARVVFIADSCHSGTMTRSVDVRAGDQSVRLAPSYEITDDMLRVEPDSRMSGAPEAMPANVTFLSGSQDGELVPEILIEGEHRGALSFSVARALSGIADEDQNRILTRRELFSFVKQRTRELAASRQTPNVEPRANLDEALLRLVPSQLDERSQRIALRIIGGSPAAVPPIAPLIQDGRVVIVETGGDLIWDVAKRQVVSSKGDVLAHDIDRDAILDALERSLAVQRLLTLPRKASLATGVAPSDKLHPEGSQIAFFVDGLSEGYLILVSISGDGTVHWLGRSNGESRPERVRPSRYRADMRVTPPFGADEIVGFATREPDHDLALRLRALDGQRAARKVAEIAAGLDRQRVEIFLQGIFTAPRAP